MKYVLTFIGGAMFAGVFMQVVFVLHYGDSIEFARRPRTYMNDYKHPIVHLDEHKSPPPLYIQTPSKKGPFELYESEEK